MTTEQIELLFKAALEEKAIYNELTGISEDKIYNWRKGRGAKPTIGDMLNVLYQLKKIMIKKASPGEVDFMNEIEEAWNKWPSKETLLEKGKLDNLTSTSRAERMLFGSSKLPGDLNTEESIIWAQPFYESSDKFSKANPAEKEGGYTHTLTFDPNKIEE